MKALSVAAGLTLAIAGTACSEQVPAEPENVAAAPPSETASAETSSTSGSRFNLRIPGGEPASQTSTSGGFNLRGPGAPSPASGPSGMRMPESTLETDPLGNVPEVQGPTLNNPAANVAAGVQTPAPDPDEDDDDLIRLD